MLVVSSIEQGGVMARDEDPLTQKEDQSGEGEMCEAEIDYNVMGTFPASDPPSWTLGISPRKKLRSHFEEELPSVDDPSHQNQITPLT
jgi:hypothetical protein